MACIIIQLLDGKRFSWPEGVARQSIPGERIVGVDYTCSKGYVTPNLESELEKEGIKWGDAIAWVTKSLGIHQCSPCQARQRILNEVSQVGWKETINKLKETF